jgi:hypothetical protein
MRIQSNHSVNRDLNNQTSFEKLVDRLPAKNLSASEKKLILQNVQKNNLLKENRFLLMETYFDNKNKFSVKDFKALFQALYGLKNIREYHGFSDFIDEVSDVAANVIAENKVPVVRQSRTNEFVKLIVNSLPATVSADQKEMIERDLKDKITEKLQFLEGRNSLVFDDKNLKKSEKPFEDFLDHGSAFAFRTTDYISKPVINYLRDLSKSEQIIALKNKGEVVGKVWGKLQPLRSEEYDSALDAVSTTLASILNKSRNLAALSKATDDDLKKLEKLSLDVYQNLDQNKEQHKDIMHTFESSISSLLSSIYHEHYSD